MNTIRDYAPIIAKICASDADIIMVPGPRGFPFEKAYEGQARAVKMLEDSDEALVCSHTGSGKTAVVLSATQDRPSLIIEPRKFLQNQVAAYRNDVVVFGRGSYPCKFEQTAATAPCRGKKYENENGMKVFTAFTDSGKEIECPFPCPGCPYYEAVNRAISALHNNGTVVSNFGNFWRLLPFAEVVIIDEADAFFQSISSGKQLKYVDRLVGTTKDTLSAEVTNAENALKEARSRKARNSHESRDAVKSIDDAENHLATVQGLYAQADLCFQYKKKDKHGREQVFVEIKPGEINALKARLFPKKTSKGANRKVIIVTATPSAFDTKNVITYEVFQRTAIFYSPVGLMTVSNTRNNPGVFKDAANFIRDTHEGFKKMFGPDASKTVVHCGSIAYANVMADLLDVSKCSVHKSGQLMKIVEGFKTSGEEYLLACAMDYGADFPDINHQFVLKVPYASLDERLQAYRKEIGESAFDDYYQLDAMNRIVQSSGRVGRGAGSVGFTFILDRAFSSIFFKTQKKIPEHFVNKLRRSGTLIR